MRMFYVASADVGLMAREGGSVRASVSADMAVIDIMGASEAMRDGRENGMEDGKLQWHPAFAAVLRIELEDEMKNLDIKEEYMLSKKPMQIDILVMKKERKEPIKKNIGRIFRTYNIIDSNFALE